MKLSAGKTLFELTAKNEMLCYEALEAYFSQMYFAN
jgi:hypothetical protein